MVAGPDRDRFDLALIDRANPFEIDDGNLPIVRSTRRSPMRMRSMPGSSANRVSIRRTSPSAPRTG
jgi:hypothetical protein